MTGPRRFDVGDHLYIENQPKQWGIVQRILAESELTKMGMDQRLQICWWDGEIFPAYAGYMVKV